MTADPISARLRYSCTRSLVVFTNSSNRTVKIKRFRWPKFLKFCCFFKNTQEESVRFCTLNLYFWRFKCTYLNKKAENGYGVSLRTLRQAEHLIKSQCCRPERLRTTDHHHPPVILTESSDTPVVPLGLGSSEVTLFELYSTWTRKVPSGNYNRRELSYLCDA